MRPAKKYSKEVEEEPETIEVDTNYIIDNKPDIKLVRKFFKANVAHVKGSSDSDE
jgi:hypothetical protein